MTVVVQEGEVDYIIKRSMLFRRGDMLKVTGGKMKIFDAHLQQDITVIHIQALDSLVFSSGDGKSIRLRRLCLKSILMDHNQIIVICNAKYSIIQTNNQFKIYRNDAE